MLPPEPDLDVASALPSGARRATLLFVHGAFADNWCWQPYFLPWFARRGFAAHALSLRGHGASGGRSTLFAASLDDYATDVATVAARLGAPAVLIGHSMGAAVVERALQQLAVPAAVLIAPVPPDGLLRTVRDLLASRPDLLADFQQIETGRPSRAALAELQPLYFADRVRPALLWESVRHMHTESHRALFDLNFRIEPAVGDSRAPVLVVAAGGDRLFPTHRVEETAARHRTSALVLPDLPHMLMLDDRWEQAAVAIDDWLARALPC